MNIEASTPDWSKRNVVLVDPRTWPRYVRGRKTVVPVYENLTERLEGWGIRPHLLTRSDAPIDIWLRDWGFVEGAYFRYRPDYAEGLYTAPAVSHARSVLSQRLEVKCRSLPVILDGGNLVHNGRIAIVTEKVILQNPQLTLTEIDRAILSLGFEKIVYIPIEPGDEIGHADGMCRFASENILLVNAYSGGEMKSFARKLRQVLGSARIGAELVELPWYCTDENVDGVPSAEGCYMNFIRLAQGIVLPTFANRKDDLAREILEETTCLPVESVHSTALARFGGVLNCISLTY